MLSTKNIKLELITEDDAEMILKLRTDPKLNKFIFETDPDIEKQKEWIREYKKRELIFFQIFCFKCKLDIIENV